MEASSQSVQAESALFEDDDDEDDDVIATAGAVADPKRAKRIKDATEQELRSGQRMKSLTKDRPRFEAVETVQAGQGVTHHVQTVKELQSVPVIVTADTTKSPPVIKIFAVRPRPSVGRERRLTALVAGQSVCNRVTQCPMLSIPLWPS